MADRSRWAVAQLAQLAQGHTVPKQQATCYYRLVHFCKVLVIPWQRNITKVAHILHSGCCHTPPSPSHFSLKVLSSPGQTTSRKG